MRSPLRPEILAQSSGLVVFGKSSFSLYSSRVAPLRSSRRNPLRPYSVDEFSINLLTAAFLARSTMLRIIAPLTKSLKYSISLSPRA